MSNINPQNIDGTYPIAGQDNNSQGFRDNFTNTINNFTFAAAELTDLQQYAVLKGALGSVGQTGTPTNDMNYTYITAPQLIKAVETINEIGTISSGGSLSVDWADAHYQTVTLNGSATLAFASTWPADNLHTKLRLQVTTGANAAPLTLPSSVSVNLANIQGASGNTITLPANGVYAFDFSTADNGTTIAIQDAFRNYASTGARIETAIQQYKPTANVAVTANVGISRVLLTPTEVISFGAYVTLPNTTVNGTIVSISSNVATTLAVTAPWLSSVDPTGNVQLTAGTSSEYTYITADSKWYKTR